MRRRGFTIIECCIVCAISVVLLACVLSRTSYLQRWLVRADLETLAAVCRLAQYTAIVSGIPQVIKFYLEQQRYSCNNQEYRLSDGVVFGFQKGLKGPPSNPIYSLVKPITFAKNELVCWPDGIMSSGTVYLTDRHRQVTYALSNAVSQVSFLRKYLFDHTWHSM